MLFFSSSLAGLHPPSRLTADLNVEYKSAIITGYAMKWPDLWSLGFGAFEGSLSAWESKSKIRQTSNRPLYAALGHPLDGEAGNLAGILQI